MKHGRLNRAQDCYGSETPGDADMPYNNDNESLFYRKSLMADRINCWEYMNCGRQPGGENEHELGVCPASTTPTFDGLNGGKNAGRACWLLAGTLCEGEVQGSFALKYRNCFQCDFYQLVKGQEPL
jgi:hypothetical protein